jgi:UDP-N-acetylmuramoyl-L-alanyl-D-glutamate--2,6-diaminopimelate ligase
MTMHLAAAMGVPTVGIGTLGAYFGAEHVTTGHTTPDPDVLYALLAMARDRGFRAVAMEVSSHAIAMEKVAPLRFAAAAFTSFTRDHLDFHPTMEHYLETKMRLFGELARPGMKSAFAASVAAQLDPALVPGQATIYGDGAAAMAKKLERAALAFERGAESFAGTELQLASQRGHVPYFATHALENFSAAWLLVSALAGHEAPASLWARLPPVPGRLEQIAVAGAPAVVVDYAHTPDAVAKTLQVLRPMCRGRLAIVFGCGGDRDPGKRPQMGQLAERYADVVYVTSDNPRTESPETIAEDILRGLTAPARAVVDVNRASAIERAIWEAAPEDLVLVAGKGHETYQIIGRQVLPFDDREIARRVLEERKAARC